MLMARELIPGPGREGRGADRLHRHASTGKAATPRTAVYCATKFGLRGFALALREDLHPKGVGVSLVMPGFIREAGMFAESGAKPPPGLGTTPPKKVGEAVVTAIRRDRAEVEPATRAAADRDRHRPPPPGARGARSAPRRRRRDRRGARRGARGRKR